VLLNGTLSVNEQQVELSFSDSQRFEQIAEETYHDMPKRFRDLKKALAILRGADVIILDEVDLGMKRTEYRDVAKELAQALHFNYVYGVEFVELNRLYLGEKNLDRVAEQRPHDPHEVFGVDPSRYLGLEGTAVLTRYPIRNARIVRLPECYDWFHGEIQQISDLERAKRWSAEKLFEERIRRQVRRGGRMALIVDIGVPEAPGQQVSIVAPHLENYCPPKCRRDQMDYLVDQIRNISNVVVLGGDLNTSGHDQTPTSIRREILKRIRNYRFWAREVLFWLIPVPLAGVIEIPLNYFKNTTIRRRSICLFFCRIPRGSYLMMLGHSDSPMEVHSISRVRGTKRSIIRAALWPKAISEPGKGSVPTFSFQRTYFHLVGTYKLDWFFIKPAAVATSPIGARAFTPFYGRTLRQINTALGMRISDHSPMTIDLPLTPPVPTRVRPNQ
jgi:endonuclease/exonuclease/phosphatase family metal-dependent hydrolase